MIENLDQNQIIFIVTVMAVSAIVVGFMAGFFGIGGGLIMDPILFYLFNFSATSSLVGQFLTLNISLSISTKKYGF